MKHSCQSLILHCMDFRFGAAIKNYLLEEKLLDNCDIVSIAGAAKNIASPALPSDKETTMKQIELSKKLHDVHEVILMNHTDCGAYGGRAAFPDRAAEDAKHAEDLASAKKLILEKYPDLAVKTLIAQIEPDGAIHIEVVE